MGAVADPCWRVSSAVSGSSRCARAARSSASSLGFKTVMAGPLERCRLNEQFACHRLIRHATLTSIAQHEKRTQWLPVHNWHFLRELSTELSTGRTACRTNTDNPSRRLPIDARRHAVRQRSLRSCRRRVRRGSITIPPRRTSPLKGPLHDRPGYPHSRLSFAAVASLGLWLLTGPVRALRASRHGHEHPADFLPSAGPANRRRSHGADSRGPLAE